MSNVVQFPMTWANAMRIVAAQIGVPASTFEEWVAHARSLGETAGHKWLSDRMWQATRKKMMREDSPR